MTAHFGAVGSAIRAFTSTLSLSLPLVALACAETPAKVAPALALVDVTIVDVASGATRPHATVLIDDGRIIDILDAADAVPAGVEKFLGDGAWVIPGLWDMHVHLSLAGESALPVLLANGIVGVRDLGSDFGEIEAWRSRIGNGTLSGPRILRAGPMLNGESFNRYQLATGGPEQARAIVRTLDHLGVDFVKVHRRVPRADYFAIVDEAHARGLPVVGHIPMEVTPAEASDSGQLIEHAETLFEGTLGGSESLVERPEVIRSFLAPGGGAVSLFARFVRNETPVTPVLGAWVFLAQHPDTTVLAIPEIRYVAGALRDSARLSPLITQEQVPVVERLVAAYRKVVGEMHGAGVTLLAGSDLASAWQIPGYSLHQELAALVDAGVTPIEALRSATLHPARVHGLDDELGTVERGHAADLVVLGANPLEDIHATRRILAVVRDGNLLRRDDLDRLLEFGARLAAQER